MSISAWRQQLRFATFRGVSFFTKTTSSEQGRRTAVHEYPMRDTPFVEDMGRKGRAFTLEAYVIGDGYMADRDDLIAALETPGPGELVHPYRGTLIVVLTAPARISESSDEGGMARFSMTFMQVDDNTQPAFIPDTPALVDAAADEANASLLADFDKKFNISGMADFVTSGAKAIVNGALNLVTGVSNFLNTGPIGELMHAAQTISGSLAILMQTPQMLASGIQGQLYALAALVNTPRDAFIAMKSFFASYSGTSSPTASATATIAVPYVPLTTPSRIQQAINQAAVVDLVRRTAIVEAARASSQITYTSYNEAQAALALLAGALDAELESNTLAAGYGSTTTTVPLDDDVYDALLALRVAVVRDISTRGANLAKLTTITLPRTMPSLVVAYRIYGDCTMDADLAARNNISRPGFVPGGVPLEILA